MGKIKVAALTGTPGTGKTAVARILKKKGFAVIDLNYEVSRHKLYSSYDGKRKTYIADFRKIKKFLEIELKNGKYADKRIIVDSHLSHLLSPSIVSAVVVLRCDSAALKERLERRGWDKEKIRENVESEIIGLIEYEARKKHGKVFVIDTAGLTPEKAAGKAGRILSSLNVFKP